MGVSQASAPQSAARVLPRLKWRLLRNGVRRRTGGVVALVLGVLYAAVVAPVGFAAMVALGSSGDDTARRSVLVIGATVVMVGWSILPLLTFGSDETLDPERLAGFPLRRGPLMRGLLAASLVGLVPVAVAVLLMGVVVGFGGGGAVVVALPAMTALLLLSVTVSRLVTSALASTLTSRRGRDVMVLVTSVVVLGVQGLRFIRLGSIDSATLLRIDDVLRLLPPGMLAQSIIDAGAGRWALAVAELAAPMAIIPAALALWAGVLDRDLDRSDDTPRRTERSRLRRRPPRSELVAPAPRDLMLVGSGTVPPWRAVAARERRYLRRDPRRGLQLANAVVFSLAGPVFAAIGYGGDLPGTSVLLGSAAAYVVVLAATNQFAFDGAALWMDVVSGAGVRALLVGKNAVLVTVSLPAVVASSVLLAALSGGWPYVLCSVLLGAGGLGAGLGAGNYISVRFPIPVPERRNVFGGGGAGQGCARSLIVLVCFLIVNLLLAPVAVLGALTVNAGALIGTGFGVVALGYGVLLWRLGTQLAAEAGDADQAGLLEATSPDLAA